jgi:hypothetical protein
MDLYYVFGEGCNIEKKSKMSNEYMLVINSSMQSIKIVIIKFIVLPYKLSRNLTS